MEKPIEFPFPEPIDGLEARDLADMVPDHLTTRLKQCHPAFTFSNSRSVDKRTGSIEDTITARLGWHDGFDVHAYHDLGDTMLRVNAEPATGFQMLTVGIIAFPLALIGAIVIAGWLAAEANLVGLGTLALGGAVGFVAGIFLGMIVSSVLRRIIVPADQRLENDQRAARLRSQCAEWAQEFLATRGEED
jgi:hypothetical protein